MLQTKYKELDNIILGREENNFIAIGATERELETDMLFNMAYNMSNKTDSNVGMFNALNSVERSIYKLITLGSGINLNKFAEGKCTEKECKEIESVIKGLEKSKIILEDSISMISLESFILKCKEMKEKYKVEVIFIDSIHMIRLDNLYKDVIDSRNKIIKELKLLAKELNITIVCIFDIKDTVEKRGDTTPLLIDFVEEIESYAKIILVIYRDKKDKKIIHFRNVITAIESEREYNLIYCDETHRITEN